MGGGGSNCVARGKVMKYRELELAGNFELYYIHF